MAALGEAAAHLALLIGGLIGLAVVGRFIWGAYDHTGSSGQRAGAVIVLLVIVGVVIFAINAFS